jgi:hypothetical protein
VFTAWSHSEIVLGAVPEHHCTEIPTNFRNGKDESEFSIKVFCRYWRLIYRPLILTNNPVRDWNGFACPRWGRKSIPIEEWKQTAKFVSYNETILITECR